MDIVSKYSVGETVYVPCTIEEVIWKRDEETKYTLATRSESAVFRANANEVDEVTDYINTLRSKLDDRDRRFY